MFRKLDEFFWASPQITGEDVASAAAQGVRLIVNNRPDGEDLSEPQGAEIEAAARAAGLDYVAIPVTHAGFSGAQLDALAHAIAGESGPVLAYCKSGTRSTLLWALTRARLGDDPEDLTAKAATNGYDLGPVRAMMDALAGKS